MYDSVHSDVTMMKPSYDVAGRCRAGGSALKHGTSQQADNHMFGQADSWYHNHFFCLADGQSPSTSALDRAATPAGQHMGPRARDEAASTSVSSSAPVLRTAAQHEAQHIGASTPASTADAATMSDHKLPSTWQQHVEGEMFPTKIADHAAADESTEASSDSASSSDGNANGCVICFDGVPDHVLMNCGHGGYCKTCAHKVFVRPPNQCPHCRTPVVGVLCVPLDTNVGDSATVQPG